MLAFACAVMSVAAEGVQSAKAVPLDLHYYKELGMVMVTNAQAPGFYFNDNKLLFSYQEKYPNGMPASIKANYHPRKVSLAFAFENYRVLHTFMRTPDNVYFYVWDLDRDTRKKLETECGSRLEYRLIVDGVWMADPLNSQSVYKANGSQVSWVDMRMAPPLEPLSPEYGPFQGMVRTVTLRLQGNPGAEVFVGGTFNSFDPYLNMMEEKRGAPGMYETTLRLLPGQYFYYFVINGVTVLDSLNPDGGHGSDGKKYSRLDVTK